MNDMSPLKPAKFTDPYITAGGEKRAWVKPHTLETLWINTGSLCNLACVNCYIESTPTNDALSYISAAEVATLLDEAQQEDMGLREVGFTGGEPFMNPDFIAMLGDALSRGFEVLVLTNAMRPMQRPGQAEALLALHALYGHRLTLRVSVDHYTQEVHETERGPHSWTPMIQGLTWLARNGFNLSIAGRMLSGETEADERAGYMRLFDELGLELDAANPADLVIFPEMDETADVPEITTACWKTLNKAPREVMCSNARMAVKRKGATAPTIVACTLIAYDERFELGETLTQAMQPVSLNHAHCARFCVLGGASCSG
ncbi:MAG: radical SAM protein [Pyruvatibacter sp.]